VASGSEQTKGTGVPRRTKTKTVALCAAAVVTFSLAPSAQADRDPVIPSRDQVDRAQQRVSDAQRSVADIQADLTAANARLEQLGVEAEQASEAYNGALVAWQDARAAAQAARQRADRAAAESSTAREALAGYFVSQGSSAPDLTSLNTALTADGPHSLLTQMSDSDASARALDAHYQTWAAADQLARVYEAAAEAALGDASDAKAAAAAAKERAADAVAAQQSAVTSIGAQREALVQELAKAQNISVALATQRQNGLEQRRQERLEARRLQQQLAQEREERRERRQHRHQQQQQQGGGGGGGQQPSSPSPSPTPPSPTPPNPHPPAPSGGAQAAIDFAYDQLGEPYVWGAAGPNSWDCSGLTMGAWAAAGVQLSHYSVSQYYETTRVSYSQLRPGDLIFWASDSSNPGTIFHVALYIGNGQMIQAPRTGRNVEVQSVFYWETPDFYGRVS
jgi:cell wall-associated NlpC family hydrolase